MSVVTLRKDFAMYAAFYHFAQGQRDQRADEIVRLGYNELTAQAKGMPGFVSHMSVRFDDGTGVIIAVFETEAQLQHFHQVGMDWIKQRVGQQYGPPYHQPPIVQFGRVTGRAAQSRSDHLDVKP